MLTGTVFDIKKFSIHDGPGIRTTVFLKGCALHCEWCHNPEGISPQPEILFWPQRCIACWDCIEACEHGALSVVNGTRRHDPASCEKCGHCAEVCPAEATQLVGQTMTVPEVMAEIEKDVIQYDQSGGGATFSGGEPLRQIEFLAALLKACKDHGIHTAVDTSGYAPPERFEQIRGLANLFLYDLKIMDAARHFRYTGVANGRILSNLRAISQAGEDVIVRIPLIPGINDDEENLRQTGEFLASLDALPRVDILPYHRTASDKYLRMGHPYRLNDLRPPSGEQMARVAGLLEHFGLFVTIGGL